MAALPNDEALKTFNKIAPILSKYLEDDVFVPEEALSIPRASTGLEVVDYVLGGGVPYGAILEVFGQESTGKSTFLAQFAAARQAEDENWRVLYLDFEQTMTVKYLQQLGVKTQRPRLFFAQPGTIEEGALLVKLFIKHGLINQFIWDTVTGSRPAAELNTPLTEKELREGFRDIDKGKSDTGTIALHARVFSNALANLVRPIKQNGVIACFPNQIRTTIDTWGAGETTSGGRALKFYASQRVRLSKKETTKESLADEFLGTKQATATENVVQFHVVKNKTAPPFRLTTVRLGYGRGFLDKETVLDLAVKRGVVQKAGGGNYTLPGGKGVRGTEAVLEYWRENPSEYDQTRMALRNSPPADDEVSAQVVESDTEDELALLEEGRVKF